MALDGHEKHKKWAEARNKSERVVDGQKRRKFFAGRRLVLPFGDTILTFCAGGEVFRGGQATFGGVERQKIVVFWGGR